MQQLRLIFSCVSHAMNSLRLNFQRRIFNTASWFKAHTLLFALGGRCEEANVAIATARGVKDVLSGPV
jgi:hypothetical protein